jgi:hypothetical protein
MVVVMVVVPWCPCDGSGALMMVVVMVMAPFEWGHYIDYPSLPNWAQATSRQPPGNPQATPRQPLIPPRHHKAPH